MLAGVLRPLTSQMFRYICFCDTTAPLATVNTTLQVVPSDDHAFFFYGTPNRLTWATSTGAPPNGRAQLTTGTLTGSA